MSAKGREKYTKVRTIGRGSFGSAVLVRNNHDSSLYVIKKIPVGDMSAKERLEALNEVDVLRMLVHPNIIAYHESFLQDGVLHIVMDYADGGDLYSRMHTNEGEQFSEDEIMNWFMQITLGLKHLHDKNILHRDLKTQNIFLTKRQVIKLGDFGIAKILSSDSDMARTVVGTPYYLSPELCEDKPYNKKSDVWALGCVLYELCTMKHAFDGQNLPALILKILRGSYPPIPRHYSNDLRHLVASMLQKDPDQRPTIDQIISLPFVRERIETFIMETRKLSSQQRSSKSSRSRAAAPVQSPSDSLRSPTIATSRKQILRTAKSSDSRPVDSSAAPSDTASPANAPDKSTSRVVVSKRRPMSSPALTTPAVPDQPDPPAARATRQAPASVPKSPVNVSESVPAQVQVPAQRTVERSRVPIANRHGYYSSPAAAGNYVDVPTEQGTTPGSHEPTGHTSDGPQAKSPVSALSIAPSTGEGQSAGVGADDSFGSDIRSPSKVREMYYQQVVDAEHDSQSSDGDNSSDHDYLEDTAEEAAEMENQDARVSGHERQASAGDSGYFRRPGSRGHYADLLFEDRPYHSPKSGAEPSRTSSLPHGAPESDGDDDESEPEAPPQRVPQPKPSHERADSRDLDMQSYLAKKQEEMRALEAELRRGSSQEKESDRRQRRQTNLRNRLSTRSSGENLRATNSSDSLAGSQERPRSGKGHSDGGARSKRVVPGGTTTNFNATSRRRNGSESRPGWNNAKTNAPAMSSEQREWNEARMAEKRSKIQEERAALDRERQGRKSKRAAQMAVKAAEKAKAQSEERKRMLQHKRSLKNVKSRVDRSKLREAFKARGEQDSSEVLVSSRPSEPVEPEVPEEPAEELQIEFVLPTHMRHLVPEDQQRPLSARGSTSPEARRPASDNSPPPATGQEEVTNDESPQPLPSDVVDALRNLKQLDSNDPVVRNALAVVEAALESPSKASPPKATSSPKVKGVEGSVDKPGETVASPEFKEQDEPLSAVKIEHLREFCESALGGDAFLKAYKLLRAVGEDTMDHGNIDDEMRDAIGQDNMHYLRHVDQLIYYEDMFYGGA